MTEKKEKDAGDVAVRDWDLLQIPLVSLDLGPNYRSRVRDLESLAHSVYCHGVIVPLLVQPHPSVPSRYLIIAGQRRYQAALIAAERKAKESMSEGDPTVLAGRYTVPCRVFRGLRPTQRITYSILENLARSDPSAPDAAKAIATLRKLYEEELQRSVGIGELMTLLEGAGQQPGAVFSRRSVYRSLRIGALDDRVQDYARNQKVGTYYLDLLSRVDNPDLQIELITAIREERLMRKEAVALVNEVLSLGDKRSDLPALIARIRTGAVPRARVEEPDTTDSAECSDLGRGIKPLGREESLASLPHLTEDEGNLTAARGEPAASASAPAETEETRTASSAMDAWIKEVIAKCGIEEVARIGTAIGEMPLVAQDILIMRKMHMFQGIRPEELPDCLRTVNQDMARCVWFGELITLATRLLGLLDEWQKHWLQPPSAHFCNILFYEVCRAASRRDEVLAYHVKSIDGFRKEEFKAPILTKGLIGVDDDLDDPW